MPSIKATYKYAVLLLLILSTAQCSVEKNTSATRFYQSMTARYNIYFNGYESFRAGILKIRQNHVDDYAEILNVFDYSDPASAQICSSDMERAIQKASKLITLKSITAKPEVKGNKPAESDIAERKEYNDWVDDSYLLIGISRFYKKEFGEASKVLSYCITDANDPLIRKEAAIWLARLYNETGKYSESFRTLTELEISPGSSKTLRSMYYTSLADMYIKQKKYAEAVDPLNKALALVSGKQMKYRLTYLLAQLNEEAGNSARATSLYRKVVKMNPPYEVEFNAKINIAGVFDVNSGNPAQIKKELERMLRDSKNKDFRDQIYYALGNLSMKEGDESQALEFFRKSASTSTNNRNQKGRSYLALADYYLRRNNFLNAGKYYDSTVFFLDQKHPDYKQLQAKSQNLNTIVSQLRIIQDEDSLQKVASMSENERNALISNIISQITKAETEGKTNEYTDRYNIGQYYENERRFQNNIDQEGKWYFYNQAALTFGRTEFRRRWGDRKLEDNWRRVNRSVLSSPQAAGNGEGGGQKTADSSRAVLDYKKPEFYLKNLPLTDSLKALSNDRIADAYLNAGKAYYEKIGDPVRATESFEKLISRFPESVLVPEALYELYLTNKDINAAKSETYRQRLLEKFGSTEFAKILSDPEYYEKKMEGMKKAERTYEQAYGSFTSENFNNAIAICDSALKTFREDQLAPKFMLLRAYCVARISDERSFKEELNKIVRGWPGSQESKKASEIIAFLNQEVPALKVEEDKQIARDLYVADTTKQHLFAIIITDPAFNINQATFDVISYNIDNYTDRNYKTEGTLTNKKYIIITVSGFADFGTAMRYYRAFSIDKVVRNQAGVKMYSFLITTENLKVLAKDENPDRYRLFFIENYLNEKN